MNRRHGPRPLSTRAISTVFALLAVLAGANAAAATPMIALSQPSAAPGQTVVVTVEGWAPSVVTVTVCGNLAARGAQDCDLTEARGLGIGGSGSGAVEVVVARPPAPCPCVVRVATAATDVVGSAPLEIVGLPTASVVYPAVRPPVNGAAGVVSDQDSFLDALLTWVFTFEAGFGIRWAQILAAVLVASVGVMSVLRRCRREAARSRSATPAEQTANAA